MSIRAEGGQRPCVTPILKGSEYLLRSGRSFRETLKSANRTAERVSRLMASEVRNLSLNKQVVHNLALSAVGVTAFVSYEFVREYARAHGIQLPDILPAIPAMSISGGGDDNDKGGGPPVFVSENEFYVVTLFNEYFGKR